MTQCITCSTFESKRWYSDNCQKCRNAAYYQSNKESIKARTSKWANANREKVNKIASKWATNNRSYKNYQEAMRRSAKLNATPKWINSEQLREIKKFYENCPEGYHVDHIMPLRGVNFSGLHVLWNLQYLPAVENLKKGNRVKEVSVE